MAANLENEFRERSQKNQTSSAARSEIANVMNMWSDYQHIDLNVRGSLFFGLNNFKIPEFLFCYYLDKPPFCVTHISGVSKFMLDDKLQFLNKNVFF